MLPDFWHSTAFLEGAWALPVCPSGKSNMQMKRSMDMEHWWNDTDSGKPKDE
jgi:hypothetical protein